MTDHPESERVSRADSEALIAAVERNVVDPRAGIFGPDSISWQINRESALFLGAGRAALLQLAHPWVATALQQHSTLMNKPIDRFHNTFRIVFTMIFGSLSQATAAARHLYGLHTRVQGELTQNVAAYRRGSLYEANQVGALRWVYATLVESAVLAYECVLPPLAADQLEAYYAESRTLAGLFGLPSGALPADWKSFLTYCREMEQSDALGVTDAARIMGQRLMAGAGSWVRPPHWYKALTARWLPERFREEFGLQLSREETEPREGAARKLSRVYIHLPSAIRFVGPWHEARARLAGGSLRPISLASNRFWMGTYRMPYGNGNNT